LRGAQFVAVCREIGLLTKASVAIDGSKFKAVNNRDKNFTRAKMERRLAQIEESVASQLDTADLQGTNGSPRCEDGAPLGEACQTGDRDAALESDREGDVGLARSADFSDRP
jgi:hypothetical protein